MWNPKQMNKESKREVCYVTWSLKGQAQREGEFEAGQKFPLSKIKLHSSWIKQKEWIRSSNDIMRSHEGPFLTMDIPLSLF